MNAPRFQKIGQKPASDLDQFPIVRDERTNLMLDRRETDRMTFAKAKQHIEQLNKEKFGGYSDWRLPECDELLTLVDRTKYSPAIDTDAFPACKSDWYWSATPYAPNPSDCAWCVAFDDGSSSCNGHGGSGFVRAVRVSQ